MTRIVRFLIMEVLILLARLTEKSRPPQVPIFVYHSLDVSGSSISLSPEKFKKQIGYLQRHKYTLQSAGQAVEALLTQQIKHKFAVLTFDDAYANIAPFLDALLAENQTATIFVATSVLGKTNLWDIDLKHIEQIEIMAPDRLQMLKQKGCELAAHTHTHPKLTEIHPEDLSDELNEGRSQFEKYFQQTTNMIAYPYGDHNERVIEATNKAGFIAGFTTQLGYLTNASDPLVIPRFPTNIDHQLFRLVVHGGYAWYRKAQDKIFG